MKKVKKTNELNLSWEEIGFIAVGMSLSSRPIRIATQSITDEYSLGPRGAWIVRLISHGNVFPLDLTKVFHVGRSLITAELNRLVDAGLIVYQQDASDGRRVVLSLTPLGEQVNKRVKQGLTKLVTGRLAAYTREEILLCARMLHDFRAPAADDPTEPWNAAASGKKARATSKKTAARKTRT